MFESLDFVYLPSRDVAAERDRYTQVFGASPVFAIEAFGTRVAMISLADTSPAILLAEHLEGEEPVLVFRVGDLDQSVSELEAQGVEVAARFGIPYGPAVELVTPGPQRIALYEVTRPEVRDRLDGRRDF